METSNSINVIGNDLVTHSLQTPGNAGGKESNIVLNS